MAGRIRLAHVRLKRFKNHKWLLIHDNEVSVRQHTSSAHIRPPPPNPGNNQNKFQVKAKLQSPNATSLDQTVPCERMTRRRQQTTANTLKVNSCEMFKYSVKIKAFVGNPELSRLPGLMDIGLIPLWGLQNPNRSQAGRRNNKKTRQEKVTFEWMECRRFP